MSDSEEDSQDTQLKIVILGSTNSGKTSIVTRYVHDNVTHPCKPTVGLDFFCKRIVLPGDKYVAMKVHDVSGQVLGGPMLSNYVHGAHGILFVYDISNQQTFDDIEDWYAAVASIYNDKQLPHLALIANKIDLEHLRVVSVDKHKKYAEENEMSSHALSARTGDMVSLCFQRVASRITGVRLPKASQNPVIVKADVVQYNSVTPVATARTSVCSLQ